MTTCHILDAVMDDYHIHDEVADIVAKLLAVVDRIAGDDLEATPPNRRLEAATQLVEHVHKTAPSRR